MHLSTVKTAAERQTANSRSALGQHSRAAATSTRRHFRSYYRAASPLLVPPPSLRTTNGPALAHVCFEKVTMGYRTSVFLVVLALILIVPGPLRAQAPAAAIAPIVNANST